MDGRERIARGTGSVYCFGCGCQASPAHPYRGPTELTSVFEMVLVPIPGHRAGRIRAFRPSLDHQNRQKQQAGKHSKHYVRIGCVRADAVAGFIEHVEDEGSGFGSDEGKDNAEESSAFEHKWSAVSIDTRRQPLGRAVSVPLTSYGSRGTGFLALFGYG